MILIKLNVAATVFRQNTQIKNWPILEVLVVSGISAALSHIVSYIDPSDGMLKCCH